ncbi:hypothetical protein ACS0TY_006095 [Phlomoides rotata]
MVMQCLGAICGGGVVKGFGKSLYMTKGGGANVVAHGYTKGLSAEIIGTFVFVYTILSATDAKRSARDSHVLLPQRSVDISSIRQQLLSQYDVLQSRIKELKKAAENEV